MSQSTKTQIERVQSEREILTPQAELREKIAREAEERKKNTKVLEEWVEVFKRAANEDGKVLLKRVTNNGYTHSWYVGRESKCQDWLKQMEKTGKYKPKSVR